MNTFMVIGQLGGEVRANISQLDSNFRSSDLGQASMRHAGSYSLSHSRVIDERYSINVDEPIIGVTTVAATTPDKVH